MTSELEPAPVTGTRALEFRRLEVKYLVDRPTRTALQKDLSALMDPDPYSGPDGTYRVRSLYFDTPDFMAYHEKLGGVAVRHKLRSRVYGDPAKALRVRMEVKSRYVSFIHKLAFDLDREEYKPVHEALASRRLPPVHLLAPTSDAREFFRLQRLYNKEPKIIVEYRRQAFERVDLHRTRVNFDDELYATRHLDLLAPLRGARPVLRRGNAVFEIKVDGVVPYWLHMLIGKYNLQNQAFSKFCNGIRSEACMSSVGRADAVDLGMARV